jgi:hypothetical protein
MNWHGHSYVVVNALGPSHKISGVEDCIMPQRMGCTMLVEFGYSTCFIFCNMAMKESCNSKYSFNV